MAAFIFLQIVFFGGFVSEVYDIHNELNAEGFIIPSIYKKKSIINSFRTSYIFSGVTLTSFS